MASGVRKFVLSLSSQFPSGDSLVELASGEAEGSTSGSFFYSAEPQVFPIWPLNFTFNFTIWNILLFGIILVIPNNQTQVIPKPVATQM